MSATHSMEQQIASLAAAVAQLELALRESQQPAELLGESLTRMDALLQHFRTAVEADAPAAVLLESCSDAERELRNCTEGLRFHGHMNQHLAHVRDFMSGMTVVMAQAAGGGDVSGSWEQLRVKLRQQLSAPAQRDLLDLILRPTQTEFVPRVRLAGNDG